MTPFIEYLAPSFPITRVMDDRAIPLNIAPSEYLLAEVSEPQPGGTLFTRERGHRLWNIARRHYFEVVLRRVERPVTFGSGWYPPEQQGMDEWRWMAGQSMTQLPTAQGDTVLRLNFTIPPELAAKQPRITVALDGKPLETLRATGEVSRDYHVNLVQPAAPVLHLSTDQIVNDGTRELGLRVRFISWGPG